MHLNVDLTANLGIAVSSTLQHSTFVPKVKGTDVVCWIWGVGGFYLDMYCLLNICVQIGQTIQLNSLCLWIQTPLMWYLLWLNSVVGSHAGKQLSESCLLSNEDLQKGWLCWFCFLGVRCIVHPKQLWQGWQSTSYHIFPLHSAELYFIQTSPDILLLLCDLLRNDHVSGVVCVRSFVALLLA